MPGAMAPHQPLGNPPTLQGFGVYPRPFYPPTPAGFGVCTECELAASAKTSNPACGFKRMRLGVLVIYATALSRLRCVALCARFLCHQRLSTNGISPWPVCSVVGSITLLPAPCLTWCSLTWALV
jgi:hypothetical protein